MPIPLFSRYSQGENRVTSTILAVLERLNLVLVEKILQSLMGQSELQMVRYTNQPKRDNAIPDGLISASFAYWIETKTTENSLKKSQLERHLKALDSNGYRDVRLIVLTPDKDKPSVIDER